MRRQKPVIKFSTSLLTLKTVNSSPFPKFQLHKGHKNNQQDRSVSFSFSSNRKAIYYKIIQESSSSLSHMGQTSPNTVATLKKFPFADRAISKSPINKKQTVNGNRKMLKTRNKNHFNYCILTQIRHCLCMYLVCQNQNLLKAVVGFKYSLAQWF